MSFPIQKIDSRYGPRRPERTSQREPERAPHVPRTDTQGRPIVLRTFCECEVQPGLFQTVSTTNDRLHIRSTLGGVMRSYRFALGDQVNLLERGATLALAKTIETIVRVGTIDTPFGTTIEVGAGSGTLLIRHKNKAGKARDHIVIQGVPLAAIPFAVSEFRKQISAAVAAL
jgi:hypothetical protein